MKKKIKLTTFEQLKTSKTQKMDVATFEIIIHLKELRTHTAAVKAPNYKFRRGDVLSRRRKKKEGNLHLTSRQSLLNFDLFLIDPLRLNISQHDAFIFSRPTVINNWSNMIFNCTKDLFFNISSSFRDYDPFIHVHRLGTGRWPVYNDDNVHMQPDRALPSTSFHARPCSRALNESGTIFP